MTLIGGFQSNAWKVEWERQFDEKNLVVEFKGSNSYLRENYCYKIWLGNEDIKDYEMYRKAKMDVRNVQDN